MNKTQRAKNPIEAANSRYHPALESSCKTNSRSKFMWKRNFLKPKPLNVPKLLTKNELSMTIPYGECTVLQQTRDKHTCNAF